MVEIDIDPTSPFSAEIQTVRSSKTGAKLPNLDTYDELGDPSDHTSLFHSQIRYLEFAEVERCQLFVFYAVQNSQGVIQLTRASFDHLMEGLESKVLRSLREQQVDWGSLC